jgi:transglutaminase-like putative cysteine protease
VRVDAATLAEIAVASLGVGFAGWLLAVSARAPSVPLALTLPDGASGADEQWFGIYVGDAKIGTSVSREGPIAGGTLLQQRTQLRLQLLGSENEVAVLHDVALDASGRLLSLDAQVRTEVQGVPVSLRAEGRPQGAGLRIVVQQGGVALTSLDLPEVPATAATLWRRLGAVPWKDGDSVTLPYFDPLSLGGSEATARFVRWEDTNLPSGEAVRAARLRVDAGASKLDVVLAPDGTPLVQTEVDGGLGMRVRAETREAALGFGWPDADEAPDLIALSAVPVRDAGGDLRDRASYTVKVEAPDAVASLLSTFHGDRFDRDSRALTMRAAVLEDEPGYLLPMQDRGFDAWVRGTTFVQSDDAGIRAQAGAIVGDRLDAREAARALSAWVHDNVDKVPVAGLPSAREVLASRRGDCNEHTTLYVAMARAVGLPARIAAGVVYTDSVFADGAFHYHAWPEVWLGRSWVPIDPTFGQFPADATHVKLVEGDLDKQLDIIAAIGRTRFQVLPGPIDSESP